MKPTRHWRRWTIRDDSRLRLLWGAPLRHVAAEIGRTPLATYWRARKLGLACGAPRGMEYLTAAAKRTGYDVVQLRAILHAAGVRPQRTPARPVQAARHFNVVDPADVDDAVATWCRQETTEEAAARLGLSAETLRRLLIEAGERPPRRKKSRWRVDSALVDRLVAEYRERVSVPTVRQHAARLGIDRTTLAKQLRLAGVLGEKKPGNGGKVRLPVEVVDRVVGGKAA